MACLPSCFQIISRGRAALEKKQPQRRFPPAAAGADANLCANPPSNRRGPPRRPSADGRSWRFGRARRGLVGADPLPFGVCDPEGTSILGIGQPQTLKSISAPVASHGHPLQLTGTPAPAAPLSAGCKAATLERRGAPRKGAERPLEGGPAGRGPGRPCPKFPRPGDSQGARQSGACVECGSLLPLSGPEACFRPLARLRARPKRSRRRGTALHNESTPALS